MGVTCSDVEQPLFFSDSAKLEKMKEIHRKIMEAKENRENIKLEKLKRQVGESFKDNDCTNEKSQHVHKTQDNCDPLESDLFTECNSDKKPNMFEETNYTLKVNNELEGRTLLTRMQFKGKAIHMEEEDYD